MYFQTLGVQITTQRERWRGLLLFLYGARGLGIEQQATFMQIPPLHGGSSIHSMYKVNLLG